MEERYPDRSRGASDGTNSLRQRDRCVVLRSSPQGGKDERSLILRASVALTFLVTLLLAGPSGRSTTGTPGCLTPMGSLSRGGRSPIRWRLRGPRPQGAGQRDDAARNTVALNVVEPQFSGIGAAGS
jgi:hypothetical protein